jgi:hypothetical protein
MRVFGCMFPDSRDNASGFCVDLFGIFYDHEGILAEWSLKCGIELDTSNLNTHSKINDA